MKKYDLAVIGGGISGVAASVSAARLGQKVLLVEKFGSLGGTMTQCLIFPFMRYAANNGKKILSDGIFTEMLRRKDEYGDSCWETFRFVFDDMTQEAGVDVLFHASMFRVETEGRAIKKVELAVKGGTMTVEADRFIDATGDGELLAMAGCDFQLGRESDGYSQPMTTCFRVCNADTRYLEEERPHLQSLYNQFQKENKIKNPRENILLFLGLGEGIVHLNTTRVVKHNPVDPLELSRAEQIARKQVYEMFNFLKTNSKTFRNAVLMSVAGEIGVRESRKLKGEHILTAQELIDMVPFEDCIALGNYEIDIHNPTGTGTQYHFFKDSDCYQIPYRSLLPKEFDNLLVAGRCLSATHEAHSAVRIMPICACLGQAAGTAMALAQKTGTDNRTLDVKELQRILKENGAAIE